MTARGKLALGTLAAVAISTKAARADLLPQCDLASTLITCAAADEGKACQGGGKCYAVPCFSTGNPSMNKVYRCDACPTILPEPAGGCAINNMGTPCADGGAATCAAVQPYCNTTADKFVCQIPAAAKPTGPPTGAGDAGSGGGVGTGGGAGTSGAAGTGGGAGTAGGAGTTGGAGPLGGAGMTGAAGASTSGAAGTRDTPAPTSSGCDVAPRPSPTSLIGLGLVVVGRALFFVDRFVDRRRRRR